MGLPLSEMRCDKSDDGAAELRQNRPKLRNNGGFRKKKHSSEK